MKKLSTIISAALVATVLLPASVSAVAIPPVPVKGSYEAQSTYANPAADCKVATKYQKEAAALNAFGKQHWNNDFRYRPNYNKDVLAAKWLTAENQVIEKAKVKAVPIETDVTYKALHEKFLLSQILYNDEYSALGFDYATLEGVIRQRLGAFCTTGKAVTPPANAAMYKAILVETKPKLAEAKSNWKSDYGLITKEKNKVNKNLDNFKKYVNKYKIPKKP